MLPATHNGQVPEICLDSSHAHRREEFVKQAEDASFIDLIACERDCRSCAYAAALDCDGN